MPAPHKLVLFVTLKDICNSSLQYHTFKRPRQGRLFYSVLSSCSLCPFEISSDKERWGQPRFLALSWKIPHKAQYFKVNASKSKHSSKPVFSTSLYSICIQVTWLMGPSLAWEPCKSVPLLHASMYQDCLSRVHGSTQPLPTLAQIFAMSCGLCTSLPSHVASAQRQGWDHLLYGHRSKRETDPVFIIQKNRRCPLHSNSGSHSFPGARSCSEEPPLRFRKPSLPGSSELFSN